MVLVGLSARPGQPFGALTQNGDADADCFAVSSGVLNYLLAQSASILSSSPGHAAVLSLQLRRSLFPPLRFS